MKERRPVVFASWIPTNTDGVVPILADAKTIVSISKNTDGVACGYREMWAHLRGREILAYLPRPANVVTIYGSKAVRRGPTGDELAALKRDIWTYDREELEAARIFADATVEAG